MKRTIKKEAFNIDGWSKRLDDFAMRAYKDWEASKDKNETKAEEKAIDKKLGSIKEDSS